MEYSLQWLQSIDAPCQGIDTYRAVTYLLKRHLTVLRLPTTQIVLANEVLQNFCQPIYRGHFISSASIKNQNINKA